MKNESTTENVIVYEDERFKNELIEAITKLSKTIKGFETEPELSELKNSVLDTYEADNSIAFYIEPNEEIKVYSESLSDDGEALNMFQQDLITLESDLEIAQLIDYLEYFTPTLYLHRITLSHIESAKHHDFFRLEPIAEGVHVYLSYDSSYHFSYMLDKEGHNEPSGHDAFVIIRGENLTIEQCRKIYKSYVFEVNAVSDLVIASMPNEPDIDYSVEEPINEEEFIPLRRRLIICDDTDKVIELYNKALCCNDFEVSILFYSKVIEFISETVIRAKVTDEVRKALSSNKAMSPDANFIKELQNLFKDHSYQKDADSIKLTVQTCGYLNDLKDKIPKCINKKVTNDSQKSASDALGTIAGSITATRNSIAHAKSNYKYTGNEIPEGQYKEFSELLRVLAQQCIRWYSVQSPLKRVK